MPSKPIVVPFNAVHFLAGKQPVKHTCHMLQNEKPARGHTSGGYAKAMLRKSCTIHHLIKGPARACATGCNKAGIFSTGPRIQYSSCFNADDIVLILKFNDHVPPTGYDWQTNILPFATSSSAKNLIVGHPHLARHTFGCNCRNDPASQLYGSKISLALLPPIVDGYCTEKLNVLPATSYGSIMSGGVRGQVLPSRGNVLNCSL